MRLSRLLTLQWLQILILRICEFGLRCLTSFASISELLLLSFIFVLFRVSMLGDFTCLRIRLEFKSAFWFIDYIFGPPLKHFSPPLLQITSPPYFLFSSFLLWHLAYVGITFCCGGGGGGRRGRWLGDWYLRITTDTRQATPAIVVKNDVGLRRPT